MLFLIEIESYHDRNQFVGKYIFMDHFGKFCDILFIDINPNVQLCL